MPVTTNHHHLPVIDGARLTEAERAEFPYINWLQVEVGDSRAEFFRYQGRLYDLHDHETWPNPPATSELGQHWDGFYSQTFFSAIVFRWVPNDGDYDEVVVGRWSE